MLVPRDTMMPTGQMNSEERQAGLWSVLDGDEGERAWSRDPLEGTRAVSVREKFPGPGAELGWEPDGLWTAGGQYVRRGGGHSSGWSEKGLSWDSCNSKANTLGTAAI